MIYEFVATVTAGFGMAGIALILRHLIKLTTGKVAPKWLIPIFAGIGMLGFQIHQEYNWQKHQLNLLPETVKVVKVIDGKVWYRPWSYIKPQVIRFMVVEQGTIVSIAQLKDKFNVDVELETTNNPQAVQPDDLIKKVNLYLFERRISTKIIPQLINCTHPATANITSNSINGSTSSISGSSSISDSGSVLKPSTKSNVEQNVDQDSKMNLMWHKLDKNDNLIKAVC